MGLEMAFTTDELNLKNPTAQDMLSEGDDHLRLLKTVLFNEFQQLYKRNRKYSFEKGNTVFAGDMLFYEAEAQYYEWQGVYPVGGYVVPSGSTPATAGGVGSGFWVVGKPKGLVSAVEVSDTAPTSPTPGLLWFDTSVGVIFVYYDDGTSLQWVEVYNPGLTVLTGAEILRPLYEHYANSIDYTLINGSFQAGAVFTQGVREVLLDESTGRLYKWNGAYSGGSKTVDAGTLPSSDVNYVIIDYAAPRKRRDTKYTLNAAVSKDLGKIPSWATRVSLFLDNVTLNGATNLLFTFLDSNLNPISGTYYYSSIKNVPATTTAGVAGSDILGVKIYVNAASTPIRGVCEFVRDTEDTNWIFSSQGVYAASGLTQSAGSVSLSGAAYIRISSANGTSLITGSIVVDYEE